MTPSISLAGVVAVGAFATVLSVLASLRAWRVAQDAPPDLPPTAVAGPPPVGAWVVVLSRLAAPSSPRRRGEDELLVLQAGFDGPADPFVFAALRATLAIVLPAAAWVVRPPSDPMEMAITFLLAAGLGYFLPKWVLGAVRNGRTGRLRRAVPNMLDLLVSCVEAGLGVDAALQHVAKDLEVGAPELAGELRRMNLRVSAGMSRYDALRELERRTGVAELGALVNVLGVVERFGAGIAESLRAHAQLARRRRALEAETRGAKASPKLTVVMILFILPPLFVVLVGSTLIAVSKVFFPQVLGGG